MDPLVGGMAVGAAGSVLSAYMANRQAEQQRADYQAAMQKLSDAVNNGWKLPPDEKFTPEEYKLIAANHPDVAQYVQEKAPQLLNESASQGLIANQQNAITQMQGKLAQPGGDAIANAEKAKTAAEAQNSIASNRANILRSYGARGLASSPQALAADLGSSDSALQSQYLANVQSDANAQARKDALLNNYMQANTSMRAQNANTEQNNAMTTNAFNERMTRNLNQYNQYATGINNQYKQQQQNVANANTELKNNAQQENYRRQVALANANNDKIKTQFGIGSNTANQNAQFAQAGIERNSAAIQGVGNTLAQGGMMQSYINSKQPQMNNMPNDTTGYTPYDANNNYAGSRG